jgi:hypothetical protein
VRPTGAASFGLLNLARNLGLITGASAMGRFAHAAGFERCRNRRARVVAVGMRITLRWRRA